MFNMNAYYVYGFFFVPTVDIVRFPCQFKLAVFFIYPLFQLDIPKESFNKYSAILIIEDIFIRREVRQMIDMLFRGLGLSRVVVQLTSVCVTYGVGLPSACVVDLGFQKTSITCVDEGVSPPDVRVALPVGVSDCMRAFHAATKHYVASDDSELSVSLE